MDSGCSKHMTGSKNQFLSLKDLKRGNVSFGNGKKGEIIGVGKVPRAWYERLSKFMLEHGYKRGKIDITLFLREKGLQIKQNPNGTMIHQHKYVKEPIKKFKMDESKEIDTPIAIATKLNIDEPGSSFDQKLYRGMIGSLLYITASRPDIVFSVGICAHFQANPKESHLIAVKRTLRYLKGTTDLCLWYPKGSNFNLVGYDDADYVGFLMDRKITSGMAHFLGSCLVSWATKK
ncbi:uncharacterized mitochondrial protein AtMg00810-like [Nicotiana sylvestris]|uniref:uncharacterized mitochondrial protein AtMg00810-like n=1 Tax=Nicotiana sylvestris TaxID=4096 RepID=UPI00388CDB29